MKNFVTRCHCYFFTLAAWEKYSAIGYLYTPRITHLVPCHFD